MTKRRPFAKGFDPFHSIQSTVVNGKPTVVQRPQKQPPEVLKDEQRRSFVGFLPRTLSCLALKVTVFDPFSKNAWFWVVDVGIVIFVASVGRRFTRSTLELRGGLQVENSGWMSGRDDMLTPLTHLHACIRS